MDIETITIISQLLTGPGGAVVVMGAVLYGIFKISKEVLHPFLKETSSIIRKGFNEQTDTLHSLVTEIKLDRDFHRENIKSLVSRIDKIEEDVSEIKTDISDIKTSIVKERI